MAVLGDCLPERDDRSSQWLRDLAARPFGGFMGRWLVGIVVSLVIPGWFVLALLGLSQPSGWNAGWEE